MTRLTDAAVSRDRESSRKRRRNNADLVNKRQKERRAEAFENRPFIGWDGEGYTDENGDHHYMLFGCSALGGYRVTSSSLSTRECLDAILYVESVFPDAYHVGFSFEYDVNMILKDLPWRILAVLYEAGQCRWEGYHLEHTPHKMFRVSKSGVSATIYDTFGFFHTSYLAALKKYHIGTPEQLARIESGKASRSSFTYADLPEVAAYWREEIALLPPLMNEIRIAAYGGGYRIHEWHGPGALATYALRYYGVGKLKARKQPAEVHYAIRSAYAGGRFQAWRAGLYMQSVYTADINSAYIYACSQLPRMDRGRWRRCDPNTIDSGNIARFGLYRIAFDAGPKWGIEARKRGIPEPPYPLFHRDRNGRLTWPSKCEGWYWSPEASLVIGSASARVLEAWVFDDDGSYPFQWVFDAFDRRLKLQEQGNPAEKAYKWALAAMYGAFARRVGWNKATRQPPSSHELAWAGFITSWCRATVYQAASQVAKRGGLISIDTDGVLSSVPFEVDSLPLGQGNKLGQWKLESFSACLYWQNGIYWYRDDSGHWSEAKSRGIPKGRISLGQAAYALRVSDYVSAPYNHATIRLTRTRFVGYRQGLRQQFKKWRHWFTEPVEVTMGGSGKGRHLPPFCRKCQLAKRGDYSVPMHTISHIPPKHVDSQPHKLPWLEPQPELPKNIIETEFIWRDADL